MLKTHFYSILHIEEDLQKNKSFSHNRLRTYKDNAITLSRSLEYRGLSFTLLTNNEEALSDISENVHIKRITFQTEAPKNTYFYSAHYKIDAMRYFSTLDNEYSILCDLDVICIKDIPKNFKDLVEKQIPICYDVTEQYIPVLGIEEIITTSEIITGKKYDRWYGGEFIGGTKYFFEKLNEKIEKYYPQYVSNIHKFKHVSDETIVTPSIESLRSEGMEIEDAEESNIMSRFWSCVVEHKQKPYEWTKKSFLVHLPADKEFLASVSKWEKEKILNFANEYERIKRINP